MSDDDQVHLMAQIDAAASAAALVIDADEQLDACIAQRNEIYAKLMAEHRRQGHRWAQGHSVSEIAELIAEKLRAMGYDDQRQRAHGITVTTLRKFVSVQP